ncbi:MAG: hypothetical protein WAW23_05410 [Candidatus Methanoperedens sp.]
MKKHDEKKKIRSMEDFEKTYFPKSFEKQISDESENSHDLGIGWAKEYLDKIKDQLKEP